MSVQPGFEGVTGEYVGRVVVRGSVTLDADASAGSLNLPMEGDVRIREWPAEGYERRILEDGRTQIDLEMVESRILGTIEGMGESVQITETTDRRNFGSLTQVNAGHDFPAVFTLKRLISVETPLGTLHNEDPIEIEATLDRIPPVVETEDLEGPNVFEAVNTPVPLLNEQGEVVAHFSGSRDERSNCVVRMVSAERVS